MNFYRHPRTRRLSKDAQHLFLASILHCVEFRTDGRFPADETPLLASVSRVRPSLADELYDAGMWIREGDEVEIRDFLEWQTSADERNAKSEAAKRAADARWTKEHAKRNASRNATSDADRNASTEKEVEKKENHRASFDEFWRIYPRRESKGTASRVWPRAVKAAGGVDVVLDGARRFAAHVERHGIQKGYVPHASTWLNGERWLDELTPPAKPSTDRSEPQQQVVY